MQEKPTVFSGEQAGVEDARSSMILLSDDRILTIRRPVADGDRLMMMFARAANQGHGWFLQLQVAADFPKDGGFLLQGARIYSGMEPAKRSVLLMTRLVGASAYLIAALWIPLGFTLVIMMGARGWIGPSGAWLFTITPAALLLLVGVLSRILGRKIAWSSRSDKKLQAAVDRQVRDLIAHPL